MKSIVCGLAALLAVACSFSTADCQQTPGLSIQSSRTDNYNPDSPWSHGKVFKEWIGHGGWFYNCDCEEDKRFSPHINWKSVTHCENRRGGFSVLRSDIQEVQTRIRAGKCQDVCWPVNPCPDCCGAGSSGVCDTCSKCDQPGTRPYPTVQLSRNSENQQSRPAFESASPIIKPSEVSVDSQRTGMLSSRTSPSIKR